MIFADVLPPPTFCMDWYMLPWPASLIAPIAVIASLIALFFLVKRPGRIGRNLFVLVVCLGLFFAIDFAVYLFGVNFQGAWRSPRPPRQFPVSPISDENKSE